MLMLLVVLAQNPHLNVVHSDYESGSRLTAIHSSTYLRNAVDPCTKYPYQTLYRGTEVRACYIALFLCCRRLTICVPDPLNHIYQLSNIRYIHRDIELRSVRFFHTFTLYQK